MPTTDTRQLDFWRANPPLDVRIWKQLPETHRMRFVAQLTALLILAVRQPACEQHHQQPLSGK